MDTTFPSRTADWPLVGRRAEVERMATALRRGAGGIVLMGPAGAGKTRLAQACLHEAERDGRRTARVLATSASASIPLGALAPLLPIAEDRPEHHGDLVSRAVAALRQDAELAPLVLLVDDAQFLDDTSATVLLHAVTDRAAFVIVTVRTGARIPEPITALWREGLVDRIDVSNLERADAHALVAAVLAGPVDGRTLHDLYEASQGSPLFLRELVLGALEAGLLRDHEIWRLTEPLVVPPSLVELVGARLAEIPREARAALELIAIGEPVELATLLELADEAAVGAAEERGLLTVATEGRRRHIRLAHPLYGEVVRAEMTTLRTMAAYRLLADGLERRPVRRREDSLRLAVWRLEGGGQAQPELMVDAARQAHFAYDDALAERLARAALEAGAGVDAVILLGEALSDLGRNAEAADVLASVADAVLTDEQRAHLAMKRAGALYWGLGRDRDAGSVLSDAESRLADPAWREELVALRATFDLLSGRPQVAVATVEPWLSRSDGRPFVEAAIAAGPALAIMGRTAEAVALADRALAAHVQLGDQQVLSDPGIHLVTRVLALGEAGRLAEAEEAATAGYDGAIQARLTSGQAWFALMRGRIGLLQGRLVTAMDSLREGAAVFADLEQVGPRRWCLSWLLLAAAQAGDRDGADTARSLLDACASTPMLMMEPDVERGCSWHALLCGHRQVAWRSLEACAARAREAGAFALEAAALHDLARVGEAEAAADRLDELATVVDGELTATRAAHARALVADDASGLDECADAFAAFGALLLAAEAAAAAASAHRRARVPRRANRSAHLAMTLARRCGASTPALALAGAGGALTPREREVAVLASEGLPNAEIAMSLDVSVRTVESHLQHAYEKLGLTSREELAAAIVVDDPVASS